jgi:hypothetical protein
MGFSKADKQQQVSIVVNYFGDSYEFTFLKQLPQSALDAEQSYIGMKDNERPEKYREALVNLVAEMVTQPPTGFDDFPKVEKIPLTDRMRAYFNDAEHPELETILVAAWKGYKRAAVPAAYIKSVQDSSARSGDVSGATAKT